ncbi:MAG: thioesterase [Clostridiaceae bacterium]|nr:thioesterase [Clostridiaceae bacterium]
MKIIALPYAGASATAYYKFREPFKQAGIEFVPIEVPGRGLKSDQELIPSIVGMVDAIYGEVLTEVGKEPYCVFGHSMGGLLAYELCKKLISDPAFTNKPLKLLVSARSTAAEPPDEETTYDKPLDEFKESILAYSLTTSEQVFEDEKLMEYFLPIMRNDFEAVECYSYEEFSDFNIDIAVFWGRDDLMSTYESVAAWADLTDAFCRIYTFDGGHFYIFDDNNFIDKVIQETNMIPYAF